jgi:hypothetical protein
MLDIRFPMTSVERKVVSIFYIVGIYITEL